MTDKNTHQDHAAMIGAMDYVSSAEHGKVELCRYSKKLKRQVCKMYPTVALRVEAFRRFFGEEYGVVTELAEDTGEVVRVMAKVVHYAAAGSLHGRPVATGMAEEIRGSSDVNTTSALENCETSAIGRALAAFGLTGGEMASASEVERAQDEQDKPVITPEQVQRLTKLFDLLEWTEEQIEQYRAACRLSVWADLTEERAERIIGKLQDRFDAEVQEQQESE